MSIGNVLRRKAWSLRTHFRLFGAVVILPLAVLAGFLLYQLASHERAELEKRMVQIAGGVAADLDRELQRRITILQTLASSPRIPEGDLAGFHRQASAALLGDQTGVFLVNRSLQQILNTNVPFDTDLPPYGAPETARAAFELGAPQISDLFIGRVIKRPVFDIAIPVPQEGELRHVLAMGVEPVKLQEILRGLSLPSDWIISIADRKGSIVARSHEQERYVGAALPPAVTDQRSQLTSSEMTLDGETVLRTTARSTVSGWQVTVTFPAASAEAGLWTSMALLGLWTAFAFVLTAMAAVWFARNIARPIQDASQAAKDLAQNRAISPFESNVTEANDLIAALHMASVELIDAHSQQQLLLGELNHRVKNLLSIVIAMTTQALSAVHLKEARDQLIGRLHSLARSHELLIANGWHGASLVKIVETELDPYNPHVRAQGPDMVLNPSAAPSLTMILHELATNAVKYGALSSPSGKVDLVWSLQQAGELRFKLRWQESDGPLVRSPVERGFGTALLERSLSQASARTSYHPDGIVYELEAPASAIIADFSGPLNGPPQEAMRHEPVSIPGGHLGLRQDQGAAPTGPGTDRAA